MKTVIFLLVVPVLTVVLSVTPSLALVGAVTRTNTPRRTNPYQSLTVVRRPSFRTKHKPLHPHEQVLLNIRGGGGGGDPFLKASGSDYSEAARVLFGNIIGPASMLTGGLVPLGFLADPLPVDNNDDNGKGNNNNNKKTQKWKKKARCLYQALAVVSLLNNLVAIMYATVATNKLTEVPSAPAMSVFALIKRDYELPWLGTNIHFLLGLLGFCTMIMLRALSIYPQYLNTSTAGLALSALVGMISILNVGIAEGDGQGHRFGGGNAFFLGCRYTTLLVKSLVEKRTVLGMVSLVMFFVFGLKTIRQLLNPESQEA